ncbi:hypothetical protein R6Z07F_019373 [Ovis aries]
MEPRVLQGGGLKSRARLERLSTRRKEKNAWSKGSDRKEPRKTTASALSRRLVAIEHNTPPELERQRRAQPRVSLHRLSLTSRQARSESEDETSAPGSYKGEKKREGRREPGQVLQAEPALTSCPGKPRPGLSAALRRTGSASTPAQTWEAEEPESSRNKAKEEGSPVQRTLQPALQSFSQPVSSPGAPSEALALHLSPHIPVS